MDSARARICLLEDGRVREVAAVVDEALRKRNYGGWYGLAERRARARAEGLRARHYQHVAAELEHVMGDTVGALVIGGHGHDIPGVAEALPRALRGRLAGTFTAEPGTLTPAGVVEPARRVLARWVTERLERLTADVLGEAAAGDRALTGLDACVAAAGAKAAALLLVSDTDRAPGTQCRGCGALEAGGRIACSRCGEKTRPVPDILDEAVAAVTAAGGEVAVVPARLLGGAAMAARLRAPAPQIVR
ncbi:baeRF10 domain-containing protein [Thermocatellispora tengchongensis]|uniref:baeRF10 domain-containing protein n=1 Tax=Thermocatellispora tengchongensis TaxID=1073253 RepID=UPI00362A3AC8